MARSEDVEILTLDGLGLAATVLRPIHAGQSLLMLHGGGATREETGFFTRLAAGLAEVGVATLRFDLRGHGESQGRQEDLTLSSILNDIRSALAWLKQETGLERVSLLGTSFSGGICAYYSITNPDELERLVLLNPLLNYKKRFIDDKPYWHADQLDAPEAAELSANGFLWHSPTFKLSRPLLNEVFHLRPHEVLEQLRTPTLFVHGTGDTFIPVDSSRHAVTRIGAIAELLEIEGAQHGFAVPEDPQYLDPQSQAYQAQVIRAVSTWLATDR